MWIDVEPKPLPPTVGVPAAPLPPRMPYAAGLAPVARDPAVPHRVT
jgi:hypothetical protein